MGTREKILQTALQLFNSTSIHQQTVRTIAAEMGISHGNLCYHYANKWLIVEGIFEQMVAEIEKLEPNHIIEKLEDAFELQMGFFKLQISYQFFFENLTEIFNHLPTMHDEYCRITESRDSKLQTMMKALIKGGALQPMSGKQLSQLMGMHKIFSNFWAVDAKYFHNGTKNAKLNYYHHLNCSLLIQYLTKKGKKEFNDYFKDFKLIE